MIIFHIWKFCVWRTPKTNTITPYYNDNDRYFEAINFSAAARLKIEIFTLWNIFQPILYSSGVCCVIGTNADSVFRIFFRTGNFSYSSTMRQQKKLHQQQIGSFSLRMSPRKKSVRLNVNFDVRFLENAFNLFLIHDFLMTELFFAVWLIDVCEFLNVSTNVLELLNITILIIFPTCTWKFCCDETIFHFIFPH